MEEELQEKPTAKIIEVEEPICNYKP